MKKLNLGISTFASIGNKADVSGNDLIQYWAEDDRTDVILLYLESFGNPKKFGQIARRVGRSKPIVAVKAGRSTAGARAASSHTGARATSDALVDTLLRQAGVIRTHTLEELFDVASLLAHQPVPLGRNVAILTNAGGPGILAADALEANGLNVPTLSAATVAALRAFLPAAASVGQPGGHDRVGRTGRVPPRDRAAPGGSERRQPARHLHSADHHRGRARRDRHPNRGAGQHDQAGAGHLHGRARADAAVIGARRTCSPSRPPWRSRASPTTVSGCASRRTACCRRGRFDRDAARAIVAKALAEGGGWLSPIDAQALLKTCGIEVAEARLARTPDEAARAAAAIGFPVAMKAVGATLLHKTEIGGVKLGVSGEHAVREAYADFAARLGDRLEAVLVQTNDHRRRRDGGRRDQRSVVRPARHERHGRHLRRAGRRHGVPHVPADRCRRDRHDQRDEREECCCAAIAGRRPATRRRSATCCSSVSQLIDACPEILEMDVNPVLVLARGAVAADVRIMIGPKSSGPAGRRISY